MKGIAIGNILVGEPLDAQDIHCQSERGANVQEFIESVDSDIGEINSKLSELVKVEKVTTETKSVGTNIVEFNYNTPTKDGYELLAVATTNTIVNLTVGYITSIVPKSSKVYAKCSQTQNISFEGVAIYIKTTN